MTDERDPRLSQRYAKLPQEEPSSELDAAILSAARRAAETRPAPLVPPTGRSRWYFPLAAAAVIVLAVGVVLHVEREQPDPGLPVSEAPKAKTFEENKPKKEAFEERKAEPLRQAPKANVAKPRPPAEQAPAAPAPAQSEAAAPRDEVAASRADAVDQRHEAASGAGAPAAAAPRTQARALSKVQSAEQELERIAELRKQGRDEEADKALAEFRKRYPDFRISDEMLKRVESPSGEAERMR